MPLPQVNDRIKEIPAQTLRAVFAGIGQMLLIADKLRARAVEQISAPGAAPATRPADGAGTGAATATKPADAGRPPAEAPSRPPQAADKPARATRAKRAARPASPRRPQWRSLDETGNVRLLDEGDGELASEAGAAPRADAVPTAPPATPAPADQVSADQVSADQVSADPPPVTPAPAEPAPAAPAASSAPAAPPAPSQSAPATATAATAAPVTPAATSSADAVVLPLANYDGLSLPSLRARLRGLDAAQVSLLLDYEKAHESRPEVVTMFERRITKLNEGG